MKYKLLATLMTALMLSMPVLGFWHPPPGKIPPPPCTYFGTLINGNYTWAFAEPADGFCENFHVTVYIANVTDMYGYEFVVYYDNTYFNLVSWTVATNVWTAQAIILNGTVPSPYPGYGAYKQVVTALPPSTGASGDFQLVDLTFHIMNDVCPNVHLGDFFYVLETKVSDSCSGKIDLCNPIQAKWTFDGVTPSMWIVPAEEVNSIVGDKFTVSVLLKDAVKMTDFYVVIYWDQYLHLYDPCGFVEGPYSTLLTTKKSDVVLNTALFNATAPDNYINVRSPVCGWYNTTNYYGYVEVMSHTLNKMLLNLTYPSETIWLFNVTFTKCDPWYCGAQPVYTIDLETHEFSLENATTPIYFGRGSYISTLCGDIVPKLTDASYTFAPVPGDLDGSGHVDIADLMILAQYYGLPGRGSGHGCDMLPWMPPNGAPWFYDLNGDKIIDIYDIVIVAKNFCRTTP